MTTKDTNAVSINPPMPVVPLLQNGDRMNRFEFERRYNDLPEITVAELVEGVVYMPSPVSAANHGEPHFDLNGFLFVYRAHTPGVRGGDNSSLRLDVVNMPQPDCYLRIEPERGGKSKLVDGIIEGPPELVVEISASSVSRDLHDKLQAYRRNEVQEYLVWRVVDKEIDWFDLVEGDFQKLQPENGVYQSRVFPGLWLNVAAAIAGDAAGVLATLNAGIQSPEHQSFVSQLQ